MRVLHVIPDIGESIYPSSRVSVLKFRDSKLADVHAMLPSPAMDPSRVAMSAQTSSRTGSRSFATFMIIGPVCFFLGIIFSSFPYDYPLLWTTGATSALDMARLETHLQFVHAAPPLIARILHIAVSVGFLGLFIKLFRPSEANLLFDGASLLLYCVGVVIYITNIVKGMRVVTGGLYGEAGAAPGEEPALNREDSLKVLAASNTIMALVLVGILVLQAGQWYAERKDADDNAKYELEEKIRRQSSQSHRGSMKKNK